MSSGVGFNEFQISLKPHVKTSCASFNFQGMRWPGVNNFNVYGLGKGNEHRRVSELSSLHETSTKGAVVCSSKGIESLSIMQ